MNDAYNMRSLSAPLVRGPVAVTISGIIGILGYRLLSHYLTWSSNLASGLASENSLVPRQSKSKSKTKHNKGEQRMIMSNAHEFHDEILKYICEQYGDQVNSFNYSLEKVYHFNEWRYRRKELPVKLRTYMPSECDIDILYEGHNINVSFEIIKDGSCPMKILKADGCCAEEHIVTKLVLTAETKDLLTQFAEEAKEWADTAKEKLKDCSKDTMNIYYYKTDYWSLISKTPKRPLSTVYLKEGEKEDVMKRISTFFAPETRDSYLSFGIPYKNVQLIHGPPGTGKTSLIKSIASDLNCDLYILPISKDMLDKHLVDAFSYINDQDSKERIIVIEDIDTLFDDSRKDGDTKNGITLQAFLNCLDGFTCVEGTALFLTANKPEVLDSAMIRSCRIDHKIKLGYADKYQTKKMFHTFLPDQQESFDEFYQSIAHKEYTTAMLQEFLFYNRDCKDILSLRDKFTNIVEKNDPKNFEIVKEDVKDFYS